MISIQSQLAVAAIISHFVVICFTSLLVIDRPEIENQQLNDLLTINDHLKSGHKNSTFNFKYKTT